MLSHELRNPLAAIGNAAQVLSTPGVSHAYVERAANIVNRQTRHLSRLIDDLLDIARVASGKILLAREKVDLGEIVENCLTMFRGSGRLDQHQVEVDIRPTWVRGDPARLTQVVDNLVTNAVKYTPAGGQIDIRTWTQPDVVLLDIGLPGLDGYQVAQQLRTADYGPRLIAITGYGQPEDRERARNAGIEHYLVKPIDIAELAHLLR